MKKKEDTATFVEFDPNDYPYTNQDVYMYCENEREYTEYCRHMHGLGLTWCDGEPYVINRELSNPFDPKNRYMSFGYGGIERSVGKEDKVIYWKDFSPKRKAELEQQNKFNNNNKENKMKKMFDFGRCEEYRLSPYGVCVLNKEGIWVSYDKNAKSIVDVDDFNFDGSQFLWKIPVAHKDISIGDVIIHNDTATFVTSVENEKIEVIDIAEGQQKVILPTTNMFGFNFITKVCSLMGDIMTPSNNSPFGNMLPLLMMQDNKQNGDSDNSMLPLMMMMGQNGQMDNSMLPMMLAMSGDKSSILPLMMMSGGNMFGNIQQFTNTQ